MVDIEHKTLEVLKMYVNDIFYLLNNITFFRDLVFGELTNIDLWNSVTREISYNELAILIIKSGKINEIAESLIVVDDGKILQSEEKMILSVVRSFNIFFSKVYELYLLDQILYFLTNFRIEDIANILLPINGFETNSYNMKTCFGMEERQTMIYDFYYEETYHKIYNIKMDYQNRIKDLLRNPNGKRKYELLNQKLSELTFNGSSSFYINKMYIALNTLINEPGLSRKRVKIYDSEQLSLWCF